MVVVLNGRLYISFSADAEYPFVIHMHTVVMTKIIVNTAVTLVWTLHVDLLDFFSDRLVFCYPGAFSAGYPSVVRGSGYPQHLTSIFNRVATFRAILFYGLIQMALSYLR